MTIPKYSCGSDDITFCGNECDRITCFRHKSNILHPDIPHSFSLLEGTKYCPKYKEVDKKPKSISMSEIKSTDKTDITMKEYMTLKENCEKYEKRLRDLGHLITQLGIPAEVIDQIDNDSVVVEKQFNPCDFRTKYRITFDTHLKETI